MSAVINLAAEKPNVAEPHPKPPAAELALLVLLGVAGFYAAHLGSWCAWAIGLYLFALARLCYRGTPRQAFYAGLVVGLLVAAGQLTFFWTIFSAGAIALWIVYAFWIGLFTGLGRLITIRFGTRIGLVALPLLWCGLEYFRSELYYLKFSWLSPGLAFGLEPRRSPVGLLGSYGTGLFLAAIAAWAAMSWGIGKVRSVVILLGGIAVLWLSGWVSQIPKEPGNPHLLPIAGVQLEFATEKEILVWLTQLNQRFPSAKLLVLSEYTLDQVPDELIKGWCREHQRYLIIGGKEPTGSGEFYNTAFVIGPGGDIVFRQAKCVPIQFFKDGSPSPGQQVWDSPWGKLGICICYDLSYTRVTDNLVRKGAEALLVPTMDVADWGKRQHQLHARVAPVRAAEYHIPVFRLASSGISQAVSASGQVLSSAPFPGQGSMLYVELPLPGPGRVPYDRRVAVGCVGACGLMLVALVVLRRSTTSPRELAC